ncbi:polysaccharide pyruvyl transferase family protein [Paenarthrobacter nitroguajacolicus]|uniref:polysaccharide pyruvyl transferase family protein n=1 Tax=Paenarthrobacter nitroguajacolicus TaxID=211146 RepID=UPI000ADBF36B|nr:polysaccharide pyruvyl transferase family protein [Paenarthrobacter nitroguajacolicus]
MSSPLKVSARKLKSVLKGRLSSLAQQPKFLQILMKADQAVLRAALKGSRESRSEHVILNSPGSGNIGDQAMFESFVRNVPGTILAIVKSDDAYTLPSNEDRSRVEFSILPKLIYSKSFGHYADLWRLGRRISGAESFSVMGADIMDGGYGQHSSMVEWNIAKTIQESGIPARVLGFSWNGRAPREVTNLARLAGKAGVRILARDPDSHDRLVADGIAGVIQATDMVFSFAAAPTHASQSAAAEATKDIQGKLAIVNVSGLIGRSIEQDAEYDHLLATLENLGYTCLLLPHVSHSNVDDISATVKLRAVSAPAKRSVFVDRLLSPTEVSALVQRADVVVTGRMHLSILALSAKKPVIVLATQGKVSGLMSLFEVPEHCIEPTEGFGPQISELLIRLESDRDAVVTRLSSNLADVKKLSALNFDMVDPR